MIQWNDFGATFIAGKKKKRVTIADAECILAIGNGKTWAQLQFECDCNMWAVCGEMADIIRMFITAGLRDELIGEE